MVLDASMGVMSFLLIQCSEGFGFPEGAGQLREQGLLHWANLWHFHLLHVRVHPVYYIYVRRCVVFPFYFDTCRSVQQAFKKGDCSGRLIAEHDEGVRAAIVAWRCVVVSMRWIRAVLHSQGF
jgi:hypothetical protein